MRKIEAMLADLTDIIPEGDDWLFEIKYDGYRILAIVEGGDVRLLTRNSMDYTDKFPDIAESLRALSFDKGISMILDGEAIAIDEMGRSNFSALQNSLRRNIRNLSYIVFDILFLNEEDLRMLPLLSRKEKLSKILENCSENISESKFVVSKGEECFTAALSLGLEGIIAKKINSAYTRGRNGAWLKIKCYKRQEFVIGGYTTSDNGTLAAILLGYYDTNKLIYIGKTGTGFSDKDKMKLKKKFAKIESEKPYFDKMTKKKGIIFLRPDLVAEIQFSEITADNLLRQPSFKGLRSDKNPQDVVLEYMYVSERAQIDKH